MNKTLYLDLDGVVVDFVRGVFKWYGKPAPCLMDIPWDFDGQMGMSRNKFWEGLTYDFWANLPFTPEGSMLLDKVESVFHENVAIITSPPYTDGAVQGKIDWVKKNLPKYTRRTFVGNEKWLLAGENKILLDDHDKNTEPFVTHGGKAVLVPRPWNERKRDCYPDGSFDVGDVMREVLNV